MKKDNFDYFEELVKEFTEQRNSLKEMIKDLERIKNKIEILFPENMDKRYIKFFEEKVKSITDVFKTILDIRKEITRIAKDEFDMRKKSSGEEDLDYESVFDIKKIAERVEKLRKEKSELEQNIVSAMPKIRTIDEEINNNDMKGEVK